MILYHGSNIAIDIIDLSKSKPNKDFGKAFYLSEKKQQAEEMATFTVERFGGKPVVTKFEFDETWLNNAQLRYMSFNEYSREWADFILANRDADTESNIHDYDIIYGLSQTTALDVRYLTSRKAILTLTSSCADCIT